MPAELDPHAYALQRIRTLTPEFTWTPKADEAWRSTLRQRLIQATGLKIEPTSLDPKRTKDHLTFTSAPGMRVFAYDLQPTKPTKTAIICLPGHGIGVDAIVGKAPRDYQNQFALQCVQQGYRTLAIEPASFGHRRSSCETEAQSSCHRDATAALMLGETMTAWRVRDAMAAVTLLKSEGIERVAIMGISGGGQTAFWTAALDPRIDAAIVSGYFNTFQDSILSIHHCIDNYIPALSTIVEMPDIAALIAPRLLFVESGDQDPIFPKRAFQRAVKRAKEIYNNEPGFESHLFKGDHIFNGTRAFKFLQKHLPPHP
ncbi:MAG: alpha/beta hydrolase family protein [Fimbriimonas sp.]